ncbi:RHS repeat-associated core domain-containing protein [Pseudomonas lundensis]|uniref:RHS repeat-associated core domain-containing protein n=1 Tax=Pseudomonas lundensis TaxID=86185 RepID=UPI00193C0B49|nr:RHS repeat-associated core domain-containing protein [Pseudomonas lundensis]MBM1188566.1 RHS repeat-associated core domain-containing protein [Pseudomonas lundensis]
MSKKKKTQTHSYAYDPLDRHVISQGANADNTQLFYCRDRVATEHRGNVGLRIFECEEAVLSYQVHQNGTPKALLIAGEENRSTLTVLNNSQQHLIAYTPYGHHLQEADTPQLLGFNGERFDPFTGYYLLGNGYRAFNPVLMRFNSPDSWSPFGEGGINAYAYCAGDPVNREDPTGHMPWKWLRRLFHRPPRTPGSQKKLSVLPDTKNVQPKQSHPSGSPQIHSPHSRQPAQPTKKTGWVVDPLNPDRISHVSPTTARKNLGGRVELKEGTWTLTSTQPFERMGFVANPKDKDWVLRVGKSDAEKILQGPVILKENSWVLAPNTRTATKRAAFIRKN